LQHQFASPNHRSIENGESDRLLQLWPLDLSTRVAMQTSDRLDHCEARCFRFGAIGSDEKGSDPKRWTARQCR
jgi:hypothetical protein